MYYVYILSWCVTDLVAEVVSTKVGGSSGGSVIAKYNCDIGWNSAHGIGTGDVAGIFSLY